MSRYKVRVLLYQRWYGLWQRHRVFFGASALRLARRFLLLNKSFPVFAMQQAKVQTVISALSVVCCVGGAFKVYAPKKNSLWPVAYQFRKRDNATENRQRRNHSLLFCLLCCRVLLSGSSGERTNNIDNIIFLPTASFTAAASSWVHGIGPSSGAWLWCARDEKVQT